MKLIVIITIVFMLMLTIVPATSLAIRPQLSWLLNSNVIKRRSVPSMSLDDIKTNILSAVVVPMLVLSSLTVSPSFAESASSNNIASNIVSKQASDRSSGNLSDRVEENENSIVEILGDIKYLMQGLNEVKSDIKGIVVLGFVVSALLLIRSEFKDNEMKKEMAETKAEMKKEMAETKAEMKMNKAEADRNFLITTSTSAGALLVSIVMTLATKK